MLKPTISYEDFSKIDIRVGTIIAVQDFPEARKPAWKLTIDFGSAIGVTDHYDKEQLLGKQILAVVNFPPKQIGKFFSEVLVLGLADDDHHIVLVTPDHPVSNGQPLY